MKIKDFARQYGSTEMRPEDNPRIQRFYNSISMASEKFSVFTKKEPDYFRFLAYAADKYYVFGYPNDRGELEGMGSLILRPCYINGKPDRTVYFLDLRFIRKRDRTISANWKELPLAFTRSGDIIDELEGCRVFHGAYMASNIYATASIGKDETAANPAPAKKKKPAAAKPDAASAPEMFKVSNLASYQAVNIYARKPQKFFGMGAFRKSSDEKWVVTRGTDADREPVKEFLDRQNRLKTIGYIYAGEHGELDRRLKRWDGFAMSSFFIARNPSGRIIGTFGVFDPGRARQYYIDAIPPNKALLARLASVIGMKVPRPNEAMDILYLTSLELDNGLSSDQRLYLFDKMLTALYKSGLPKKYHIVSFCDYNKQSLLEVVSRGYMFDATPVVLFQVHPPEATEIYRESDMAFPPGHEMVLM